MKNNQVVIGSWGIRSQNANIEVDKAIKMLSSFIKERNVDILGLQKLKLHAKYLRIEDIAKIRESENFLKQLSDTLSYETGSSWDFVYSVGNDDKLNNVVLYKGDKFECKDIHTKGHFFLKENENIELKMKENTPNILHFTLKTNAKCEFYFVNVEMPAHKKDDNWTVWYKEAEVLKKIYDFLSKKGATIMGGYFHATPICLNDSFDIVDKEDIHSCGQATIITKPNSKN